MWPSNQRQEEGPGWDGGWRTPGRWGPALLSGCVDSSSGSWTTVWPPESWEQLWPSASTAMKYGSWEPCFIRWWKVKSLSRVRLFATPWTAAYQAPLSMGFSRQEYWSGLPCPSPNVMYIYNEILTVKVKVPQSCLTLCDPVDYTVHGILQARILEWVVFPFLRGSSQARDWT